MSLDHRQAEPVLNVEKFKEAVATFRPMVQDTFKSTRERARNLNSRGELSIFAEGELVLMARDDLTAGEKLSLRWRSPRRIVKALSDYVYQVYNLRTGLVEDVHGSMMKLYHDATL